ncbi:aldo/keto reductase [Pseudomonas daroniae]|uniref:Aldo/keto reductase n=1 Tax=Phytopseudomonas daroniae TaxID=2487519 RepID=A0A4Q9QFC6_9GAMM|nr:MULTISPECIES: aldo/keto reductase [Pseudomonas]TBU71817.1 aldo/keto reductase [Pseudomonas daroniae]TBU78158.1 aldo/keto reductase [Pseudomonas sp. FRB 228]TBU87974.1 aldo/keto reductase [Pseudomonas daroniae]
MTTSSALDQYRLLGRSGLRVSPLALGTMTFGTEWGWGADDAEARRIFDAYVDRGGNFIDTAVNYTNGTSERILGGLIKDKRDRIVLSTKFTMAREQGNPNSGGNHRFNLVRSVEASLRQLDTDRIDLLHVHAWDFTTTPEEVLRSLDDLVRAGKILYVAICNTPAWRVAQMQAIADLRGWSPFVALQIEYSLVERTVEHELVPMAQALGLGILPWSPLGGGILTGKYSRADLSDENAADVSPTRKGVIASTGHLNERALAIADVVGEIAEELGASRSQVALAWTLCNPAVVSPIVGARTLAQAEDNFGALSIAFTDAQLARLNEASALAPIFPERFMGRPMAQQLMFGGTTVVNRRG